MLAGAAAGLAIALKLLVWPLFFWLLFTRRFRAALVSLATAAALILGSWAVIGFRGFTAYPSLLAADAKAFEGQSHSIVTLAVRVGLSATDGRVLAALATVSLLLMVYREAANEAFNITNGDVFEWRNVWPGIAETLGVKAGPDTPMSVTA